LEKGISSFYQLNELDREESTRISARTTNS
jgi:hypothetical protein